MRTAQTIALALACAAALAGCRAGGKGFENENDALRRRVAELESEVDALRARATEAEAKLADAARARESTLEGQALEALPRVAGISIGRFSGLIDTDDDGAPDSVDVSVRPFDGRQRFVQVTGRLTVEAVLLPGGPGSEQAPVTLAVATLSPIDLREAYRSSPMGTHYLVTLPVGPLPPAPPNSALVVRAELLDTVTGLSHRAERIQPAP